MAALKWQSDDVLAFLHDEFPQAFAHGAEYTIKSLEPAKARVGFVAGDDQLRPGGVVSGPALFTLVDFSIYMLLLALHRESAKMSVTTNLQISFLRKAGPGELLCDIEMIKHGRTLSVADARIISAADQRLIAHAEATYYMGGAQ